MPDSAHSAERPNLPAIATTKGVLSFLDLNAYAAGAIKRLRETGVASGDVVGVALGQTVEAIIVLRALIEMGAVACMLDARWPRSETARAMSAARCNRVVADFALVDAGGPAVRPDLELSRPATVIFTSGSTSEPKPAVHSLDNHLHSAAAANANIPLQPGDSWLLSLPLHHVAGIGALFRCARAGAAVAVPEAGMSLKDALAAFRPTHLSLVPTQLGRLLADENAAGALAGAKAVLMGGAPMPPGLVRQAFDRGVPIHTSYGLTETSSQITATKPGDDFEALMTSGTPLTPETVSVSGEGEILVRGNTLFLGYVQEGGLQRPLTPNGWFATGDTGRFDDAGRLVVAGRRDNMFISGGENVQPEEIERRLCELPGVEQALVVPVPDDEYGEVGLAFVDTASGEPPDAKRVRAQLRELLPAHKIPKQFRKWPANLSKEATKLSRRRILSELA